MTKTTKAPKTLPISKIQLLQLELLRASTFNELNGGTVADSLLENRDLWIAALIDREAYTAEYYRRERASGIKPPYGGNPDLPIASIDTIRLRDMALGYWNVDALFILPAPGKEEKLELLAHTWNADEIHWYHPLDANFVQTKETKLGQNMVGIQVERMLRVWWD